MYIKEDNNNNDIAWIDKEGFNGFGYEWRVWSNLPEGQVQPSVQWSSQSADRSGLLQVSEQGEPHSWCCMLKGHDLAENRKSSMMLAFPLKCWERVFNISVFCQDIMDNIRV